MNSPSVILAQSPSNSTLQQKSPRIVLKFRETFANEIEAVISPVTPGISVQSAASPTVSDFMARYSGRTLAPLYPEIVIAKQRRNISGLQIATEVRRRFPQRSARLKANFNPPDVSRTYVLDIGDPSTNLLSHVILMLKQDPRVEFAEEDKIISVSQSPNDPYFNTFGSWGQAYDDLWGLKNIGMSNAWDISTGTGITVAVVDTGLDYNHPDISTNVWLNRAEIAGNGIDDDHNGFIDDVRGWSFISDSNEVKDDYGHGTLVSGTIAAAGDNGIGIIGVAWHSRIMPVKALDSSGHGYESQLSKAIVYAANEGADVINNSWGGLGPSDAITEAVKYAHNLGAVVIASAGNDAMDARAFCPAMIPETITVAASGPDNLIASFSNFGDKIDVAAPGVDILSLRGSGTSLGTPVSNLYSRASGTSLAAPHVSGVAALVLSAHPEYTNEQVRQVLRASATNIGTPGFDPKFGYGLLNAASAGTVTQPLEAKITSPSNGTITHDALTIAGFARGTGFASYILEYGAGTTPQTWTILQTSSAPVTGTLGTFDATTVPDGLYIVRLRAINSTGAVFQDRLQVVVRCTTISEPVPPRAPTSADSYKPGSVLNIKGIAVGADFESFNLEWARGINAGSGWQSTGISLAADGQVRVSNGALGQWDTSSITAADYYTLRLTVHRAAFTAEARTIIYLQPALLSVTWPRWVKQGPNQNAGTVPALTADGSWNLMLASPPVSEAAILWSFTPAGIVQPLFQNAGVWFTGSANQPAAAELDGNLGDEVVFADGTNIKTIKADGSVAATYTTSAGVPTSQFFQSRVAVEDLDNDSRSEIVAFAGDIYGNNDYGYLFAWHPDGQLFTNNFPIQLADQNDMKIRSIQTRLLVGDFNGDGTKEIVAIEGLTKTSFTLRLFQANGTALNWNVPTIAGVPEIMIAADLDKDGKLETILVSYEETKARLHVFQSDGTERPGWPLEIANPVGTNSFLAVGDLDRDGKLQIALTHETQLYLFNDDGTVAEGSWPASLGNLPFATPVVIGDVDGDGYPDLVTLHGDVLQTSDPFFEYPGYIDQKLQVFRRDGTPTQSWQLTGMNGYDLYVGPTASIGDVDQDGITDITIAYEVTGPGGLLPGVVSVISTGAAYRPELNDWPLIMHDAHNSGVLTRKVEPSGTITTVSSSSNPSTYGQPIVLTLAVNPQNIDAMKPSGAVTLQVDGVSAGSCTLVNAVCTYQLNGSIVGSHLIDITYSGDTRFKTSTTTMVQRIDQAATTAVLTSSLNPATAGEAVTFTATVSALAPGAGTPRNTVTFFDGNSILSTSPLNSSGVASVTVTTLSVATHNVHASYAGDLNFTGSTSSIIAQRVNAGFSLTASETQTVAAGQRATYSLNIIPDPPPYNASIGNFRCAGLPTGAACAFDRLTVTPGGETVSVQLYISTTARTAAASRTPNSRGFTLAASILFISLGSVLLTSPRKPGSRLLNVLWLVVLLSVISLVACGGGASSGGSPPPPSGTPAGTYSITVSATGSGATQQTVVSLIVN